MIIDILVIAGATALASLLTGIVAVECVVLATRRRR